MGKYAVGQIWEFGDGTKWEITEDHGGSYVIEIRAPQSAVDGMRRAGAGFSVVTENEMNDKRGRQIKAMKNVKTKDFEEAGDEAAVEVAEDEAADPGVAEAMGDDEPEEKFSAQILRRIHEHHSLLMQEYDELAQMNEHPEVGEYLTELLEGFEQVLTAVEELFEKHHGDLPPLEGAMGDKDMEGGDEETTEADSEEEELPTPDEVVEGMETKSLKNGKTKGSNRCDLCKGPAGPDDYSADGSWTVCDRCMGTLSPKTQNYITGGDMSGKNQAENELRSKMKSLNGKQTKVIHVAKRKDMTKDEADKIADDIKKEAVDTEEKHLCAACKAAEDELTDDTLPGTPGDEAAAPPVGADETTNAPDTDLGEEAQVKSWLDEHRPVVGDSAVYLKGVSETQDFNDDSRHEAYYHGKMLDKMCEAFPQMEKIDQMSEVQAGKGVKEIGSCPAMVGDKRCMLKYGHSGPHDATGYKDFPAMDEQAGACQIQHPHYKACSGAGSFLKELANVHDFGMPHQEKALAWHKELDAMSRQDEVAEVGQGDNPIPLGEMQEKSNADAFEEMDDEVGVTEKSWYATEDDKALAGPFDSEADAKSWLYDYEKSMIDDEEMKCGGPGGKPGPCAGASRGHREGQVVSRSVRKVGRSGKVKQPGKQEHRSGTVSHSDRLPGGASHAKRPLNSTHQKVEPGGDLSGLFGGNARVKPKPGPGARPLPIPKKPTTYIPKKDLDDNDHTKSLADAFIRAKEEQDEELKQMKELSRKLAAVAGKL